MRTSLIGLAGSMMVLASCSDSNGPVDTIELTPDQPGALAVALVSHDALGPDGVGFAAYALSPVREAGIMGEYTAVGIQVNYHYTYTVPGVTHSGTFSSIVGWQGLDPSAATVDRIIAATQFSNSSTFPDSGSVAFGDGASLGSYVDGATGSGYTATSGGFRLTAATFAGTPTSCDQQVLSPIPVTCSYTTGTMTGSFDFTASRTSGGGALTFTQPTTSFELPAIRVTISYSCQCYPDE